MTPHDRDARLLALNRRLVIIACTLAGAIAGLFLARYLGWGP
jgi:hypothetical protein